jgi:2-amino-4-hydroxy-6-hydroxymethyldihydropteridine diphosphokinase
MKAYISIGSNLGNRLQALTDAYHKIGFIAGEVIQHSSVFESEPWGFSAETDFYNMVLELETALEPIPLMKVILQAELEMGRIRQLGNYNSRAIDIDILLFEDRIIQDEMLVVPHPRMHLRRFVLVPLVEISPVVVHPVSGISCGALLVDCPDQGRIKKVMGRNEFRELIIQNTQNQ